MGFRWLQDNDRWLAPSNTFQKIGGGGGGGAVNKGLWAYSDEYGYACIQWSAAGLLLPSESIVEIL